MTTSTRYRTPVPTSVFPQLALFRQFDFFFSLCYDTRYCWAAKTKQQLERDPGLFDPVNRIGMTKAVGGKIPARCDVNTGTSL